LGWDVFTYNGSDRKIYVPAGSVNAYKSATNWSEYADAIVGYDFEESEESGGNFITFTVDGIEYQAEEGMTWEEWVGSSFNTDNKAKLHGQNVVHSCYFVASGTTNVAKTDVIVANRNYKKTNTAIC
jgi:hypothetical protein